MKNKLLITFGANSSVLNIPAMLIFDNELDAYEYFNLRDLQDVVINAESGVFDFKSNGVWMSTGKAQWVKHY